MNLIIFYQIYYLNTKLIILNGANLLEEEIVLTNTNYYTRINRNINPSYYLKKYGYNLYSVLDITYNVNGLILNPVYIEN